MKLFWIIRSQYLCKSIFRMERALSIHSADRSYIHLGNNHIKTQFSRSSHAHRFLSIWWLICRQRWQWELSGVIKQACRDRVIYDIALMWEREDCFHKQITECSQPVSANIFQTYSHRSAKTQNTHNSSIAAQTWGAAFTSSVPVRVLSGAHGSCRLESGGAA